jgi:hypothetical protein
MPCLKIGNAIVCTRGRRETKCFYCGAVSTILCDFPVLQDQTCDRPTCRDHAKNIAVGRDYCKEHADAFPKDR